MLSTNAATLLILVIKTRAYPSMTAAPRAGRTRHPRRLRLQTAVCLIFVTLRVHDLGSSDARIAHGRLSASIHQTTGIEPMIRNKPLRRSLGALLVLLGALLIWLPYDLASGIVLVLAGAVLELVGITLERNDKQT